MKLVPIVSLCAFIGFGYGLRLPSYIKNCIVSDVNFKECALKSGNDAIPILIKGDKTYNIPPLDPLILPAVSLTGIGGLQLNATNLVITGFRDTELIDVGASTEKQNMFIKLAIPLMDMDFKYSVDGNIAALPIEGNGQGKIQIHKGIFSYGLDYKIGEKRGKRFMQVIKDDIKIEPKGVNFNFDNLFGGDKILGDQVNKFLNENWREIMEELTPSVNEVIRALIRRITGYILQKVPIEEIFPDS
ncbi:hypothetical protein HHI36_021003 [Cryptolaemus montrouzieri]|uniref:Uncharacterized protein n=1 Tax=Cryptolaemus montrouzieri TaxID=559131 RepID=A0ABD2MVL6_9CUCU